ncbi:unnamed protein product [Zymoseptoria tritici ST99CH_3D7]|uniref:Uncharacterized protein n=1 Tax=Zymoseptoria tritici (strain ST99CH_3D7) TaxID=1276538 RepID=A0A1X7S0I9_ZYMT9|nr:unnamed protein product [Zymoseptoria tritici ST99CH_3D7]
MSSINHSNPPAATPTARYPLLETIPPEIRLQIYDLVFASASNVELLATCTAIYDEARASYNTAQTRCFAAAETYAQPARRDFYYREDEETRVSKQLDARFGPLLGPGIPAPWIRDRMVDFAGGRAEG